MQFFFDTVQPSMVEHPVAMPAVYPGVSVSFSCRAEGFSMLNYSWFVVASGSDIGMEIENETNPMYTISDPRYDQDDTGYYCIATNNEGIAVSNTASLSGNFSLFMSSSVSLLVCLVSKIHLYCGCCVPPHLTQYYRYY